MVDTTACSQEGCSAPGTYPAPASKTNTKAKIFFCLKHIREYNSKWNYFAQMSDAEVEQFHLNKLFEGKQTKPFGVGVHANMSHEEIIKLMGIGKENEKSLEVPGNIRKALALFELTHPADITLIKKAYRKLAKIYHPDLTPPTLEEKQKFHLVKEAYELLLAYYVR